MHVSCREERSGSRGDGFDGNLEEGTKSGSLIGLIIFFLFCFFEEWTLAQGQLRGVVLLVELH